MSDQNGSKKDGGAVAVQTDVRIEEMRFKVCGAGELIVGTSINGWCGDCVGFHVGATWGRHGETGGIMDREQAKELAEHILRQLEEQKPLTRAQMRKKIFSA